MFYKIELILFGSPLLFTGFHRLVLRILRACVSRQLLIHNHKMEVKNFEIRVFLKHYCKQDYKAAAAPRRVPRYMKWKEKLSLVNVWNIDDSNVATLEKKTLKIYHIMEDLNYGILRIYAEF